MASTASVIVSHPVLPWAQAGRLASTTASTSSVSAAMTKPRATWTPRAASRSGISCSPEQERRHLHVEQHPLARADHVGHGLVSGVVVEVAVT
jgi:hypothetical protein